MAARLNKTETAIFAALQRKGLYGTSRASGQGPKGRRIHNENARDYDACLSLVKKGLATVASQYSYTESRHGRSLYVSTLTIAKLS